MSAYVILNYTVTNLERYKSYGPAALPTLAPFGAEILVSDFMSEALEGTARPVTVVLRWPSKEAAKAWYESPEYQAVREIRRANTEGVMVLCDGFVMPD